MPEDLLACRGIGDTAARAKCYDEAIDRLRAAPARSATPAPAVAAAPGAPAAAGVAAPAAASWQDSFGLVAKTPESQSRLASRINGRFRGWSGGSSIELANGQVWQIADGSQGVCELTDPPVEVRRGMLGVYYLDIAGINQSPKVRRLR